VTPLKQPFVQPEETQCLPPPLPDSKTLPESKPEPEKPRKALKELIQSKKQKKKPPKLATVV
jgi:hypothetical protein